MVFCQDFLLQRFQAILGDQFARWLGAAESLIRWMEICRSEGMVLSAAAVQQHCDSMKRHLRFIQDLVALTPKHHLWVHLTIIARLLGNPLTYHTFLDESLNKVLKKTCTGAHQMRFEKSVLNRMREYLSRHCAQRKRC